MATPFATGGPILSSPSIGADGTIYVGSDDGKVYAVKPDGTAKWAIPFATGGGVRTAPAIGSDGTIYVGSRDSKIFAINADGGEQWVWDAAGEVNSSPAIGPDGTVYVGSNDCKLYALFSNSAGLANSSWPMFHRDLNRQSRMFDYLICWTFATGGAMNSSPAIGPDGTIYVGSNDKKVYALRPNGNAKWITPFTTGGEVESSPTVGGDGAI